MLKKKVWFVWFAAFLLGLAIELSVPADTAEAAVAAVEKVCIVKAEENGKDSSGLPLLCAEDVWVEVYEELMFGSEMTS